MDKSSRSLHPSTPDLCRGCRQILCNIVLKPKKKCGVIGLLVSRQGITDMWYDANVPHEMGYMAPKSRCSNESWSLTPRLNNTEQPVILLKYIEVGHMWNIFVGF